MASLYMTDVVQIAIITAVPASLVGIAAIVTAFGANRKAADNGKKTDQLALKTEDIATKVDGGSKRADEQIAALQKQVREMHDQFVELNERRVADVKEAAVQAATVAAHAVVPPVIADRRKEEKGSNP